ncbi:MULTISPECIES: S-methyl-5-thioribose-1-phosphate isomerase [Methylotenera]|uniref:S-methyl-5-thioribose-1-phosphate isomerase n=1 Tax=Methylotenera TaxID=359407 RepID=UPI00037F24A3|nr:MULTISPECIES: S-methyl-5-thioribose-1-phosphate isomerase [Methylotenera]
MKVAQQPFRTIWPSPRCKFVQIVDQTQLPFAFQILAIYSLEQMIHAIKTMQVRGAPLIGAAAAYGMALAMLEDESDAYLVNAAEMLKNSRPTAVNLAWAVNRMVSLLQATPQNRRNITAWREAANIAEEDVTQNQSIGQHGLALIKAQIELKRQDNPKHTQSFNILTHCNAGWLATVDFGTALSPIYAAHDAGLNVHVWVDETRPRNQGAALTAWELAQHGVPHTVISDNAGGHLMQQGLVDMVIVGADRVTANGDVCNKIGTYLKALAAFDNHVQFYAAVPSPTIDWTITDYKQIEIEERDSDEVRFIQGLATDGSIQKVRLMPVESKAANPAFDITPARLVTGIITEKGIFSPDDLRQILSPNA